MNRDRGSITSYFGYDGQGSVRYLSGPAGTVTDTYTYDAFGLLLSKNGTTLNSYLYTGEQWDEHLGMYYLRARYANPDLGRFWTMDTFEGSQEDPLSLHKYLYCAADLVNNVDPTGEFADAISFNTSAAIGIGLVGLTAATVVESKTHAIGNLMVAAWNQTTADAGAIADAAESALSVARTSTKERIKQAKDILKQAGQALKNVKIVPVPRSIIPNVANHVAMAQAMGQPRILTRATPATAIANRAAALAKVGGRPAGVGMSWDEHPFASSAQGGAGASVSPVPWLENSIQSGIISAAYAAEKINVGTPYYVLVIP